MLGFDVFYSNRADDDQLIEICRGQGRVLLTRDAALAKRAKSTIEVIFVEEDCVKEQLTSLSDKVPLAPRRDKFFSRCIVCNSPLIGAKRHEVEGSVPEFVFNTIKEYKVCPRCRKVYWQGSHADHAMRSILASLSLGDSSGVTEEARLDKKQNGSSPAKSS